MNNQCAHNRQALYALTADEYFPQPGLNLIFQGRVEQVFNKAINLLCENTGELYSLTCSQLDNAVNSCRLLISDFSTLDIKTDDYVYIHNAGMTIGEKYQIDFSQCSIWRPDKIVFKSIDSLSGINTSYWLDTAIFIEQAISKRNCLFNSLFGSLFNYAGDNLFYQQISQQLSQSRQQLTKALIEGNENEVKSVISKTIGLGIGLTPTADDYLSGMSLILFIPKHAGNKYRRLFQQVVQENRSKTTLLSAITLEKAINNQSRDSISQLLSKVFNQFNSDINQEIEAVMNIGSSSGSDMLYGMVDALYLTHYFEILEKLCPPRL